MVHRSERAIVPELLPIVRVTRRDLPKAIESLVMFGQRQTPTTARGLIAYAESANIDLDQCWAVIQPDGRHHPVCLAIPSPGATAMIFTSDIRNTRNTDLRIHIERVVRHALRDMDATRIRLAQSLIPRTEEGDTGRLLEGCGFRRLADLSYLERRIGKKDATLSAQHETRMFTIEAHDGTPRGNEGSFSEVIEASYTQTLDCPGLRGLRTMPEVMEGHRATGCFVPDLWFLARCAATGQPAGVLLLNPLTPLTPSEVTTGGVSDDHDEEVSEVTAELVYLGIHPDFRRCGLARQLLDYGIGKLVRIRRIRKLVLAVDEANEPARNLYKAYSFYRTERRIAYIYPLS